MNIAFSLPHVSHGSMQWNAAQRRVAGAARSMQWIAAKRDFYRIFVGCTFPPQGNKEPAAIEKGLHKSSRVKIGKNEFKTDVFERFLASENKIVTGIRGEAHKCLKKNTKRLLIYVETDHLHAICTRIYIEITVF